MTAGIDPDLARLLERNRASDQPSYSELGAAGARATFRAAVEADRGPGWAPEPVAEVSELTVTGPGGPIPVRRYRPTAPASDRLPVVVYFHGGGWTIGDLDTHDAQARMLANAVDAVVVSVDYRLAPEHPYPAALQDAVAAMSWAAEHAARLGGDAGRLAVAGDSSGGNLAAAAALWARDHGGPALRAQCLIYPVVSLDADDGSWREFATGFNLDASSMAWFNGLYAPPSVDRSDPYLAPLAAADLSGLPAAVVAVASHDVLRDQGEAYARRLEAAGVPVVARRYDGMVHSFFRYGDISPAAHAANTDICAEFRTLLAGA